MRLRGRFFLLPITLVVALGACGGPQWEPLTDENFARFGMPLKSSISAYMAVQTGYFAAHERYARHGEIDYPPTVRVLSGAAADYVPDGFNAIAYNDSVPQMICGVFVGTATPPLSVEMVEGVPTCALETSILVCEEGHAYPASVEYNFCPMHGHELVEVKLIP